MNQINCLCGEPAILKTVKKAGPNTGKQFYACAKPQGQQCDFFEWADQPKPRIASQLPPRNNEPNWNEINARKEEGMEWLNAKNGASMITAAMLRSGLPIEEWYETYKEITKKLFTYQEPE